MSWTATSTAGVGQPSAPQQETLRDVLAENLKRLIEIHARAEEIRGRLGLSSPPASAEKRLEQSGALHVAVDLRSGLMALDDRLLEILNVL